MAGYRIINHIVTPITDENEIKAIQESLEKSKPFKGVYTHLSTALKMLSDRKNPDYRNSIKESISAVESIANVIAGEKTTSLAPALKVVKDKIKLHSALERKRQSEYT